MMLTLEQAEQFVESSPNARWNGWNLEIFADQPNACLTTKGVFFNGRWCAKSTVSTNDEGKYVISKRNAATAAKSWN